MMTKEESLELAKKCGAVFKRSDVLQQELAYLTAEGLFAYTSAIEDKYQAQIAMLRDALSNHRWHDANCVSITESGCPPCDCGFEKILDDTQQSSDAFIAEVKARAESDGVKNAMELLLKHGEDHDWRIMAKNMGNTWAELRNQARQSITAEASVTPNTTCIGMHQQERKEGK